MKRYLLRISVLLLTAGFFMAPADAQTGSTYVYINPIYAFPAGSSKLFETNAERNGVNYTQGVYGSFGSGFSIEGGVGKMINNNFGVELAAQWVDGKKIYSDNNSETDSIVGSQWEKVNSFLLKPMIRLRNSGDLMTFYSKLGLAISVYSSGYSEALLTLVTNGQSSLVSASEVTKFRATVGFTAAFGVSFRVSQSVAITGELSGLLTSLPETSGYYSAFSINGQNQLPIIKNNVKSWNYKESISDAPGDPDKPGTRLYEPKNYSYIGISIGFRYYL